MGQTTAKYHITANTQQADSELDNSEQDMLPSKFSKTPWVTEDATSKDLANMQSSCKNASRLKTLYFCALLFLLIFASASITIFNLVESGQYMQRSLDDERSMFSELVCLQCIKLIKNPFSQQEKDPLLDRLIKRVEDGIQMCCASTSEQMSALLEAYSREQVTRPYPAPRNTSLKFISVSAHKQLLPNHEAGLKLTEPVLSNGSTHFIVRFNTDYEDTLTEHAQEVIVRNTSLEVKHSGMYYVYFSVHMALKLDRPIGPPNNHQSWYQYVHRTNPNSLANSGILLQTTHTPAVNFNSDEETAFSAGTFYLREGDHLEVCLSALGLVRYKKESSYLGLVMLASDKSNDNTGPKQ